MSRVRRNPGKMAQGGAVVDCAILAKWRLHLWRTVNGATHMIGLFAEEDNWLATVLFINSESDRVTSFLYGHGSGCVWRNMGGDNARP